MNTILTDDELEDAWCKYGDEMGGADQSDALRIGREIEAAVLAKLREQEPVAYGMPDTQLGRKHRLMMVRLDKGQDGCTLPLYAAPLPAVVQVSQGTRTVPLEKLDDWRQRVNTLAALSTKADRHKVGVELKQSIRDVMNAAPEAPAQAAPSADEVERGDVVAFEFYNRATGHAIVDYSVNTHVGNLSADKGYEARPLVYADKREEVTDGSKPIPLWQAREALDELEAAARGDEPFNHFAAGLVRSALEQAAAPEAPAQADPMEKLTRIQEELGLYDDQPAQPIPAPWREAVKRLRKNDAAGDTVFRCGFNAGIDAALAQLDALEGGK